VDTATHFLFSPSGGAALKIASYRGNSLDAQIMSLMRLLNIINCYKLNIVGKTDMRAIENHGKEIFWKKQAHQAYSHYLQSWKWEWFATLTFRDDIDQSAAKKWFILWIQQICIGEGIQVGAAYGIACVMGHPHIHSLMLGRAKTIYGIKTLVHVDPLEWQQKWRGIAKVENVRWREGSARYVAKHFLASQDFEICLYNVKLLKKLREY